VIECKINKSHYQPITLLPLSNMNLPFNIAKRYFFSRKGGGSFSLISILSVISLLGYIVGAAALIVVLSVFNGFEGLFMGMYNTFDADMQITAAQGKTFEATTLKIANIKAIKGVEKVSFVLEEDVLLKYGERQNLATVKGVDEQFVSLTGMDSSIVAGTLLLEDSDKNFAIVGQGVAYQLSIDPNDIFEGLQVYVTNREEVDILNPTSAFSRKTILPIGVFSVQEEVDNKYVVVPIRFLHELLNRPNEYSSLELKLAKEADMDNIKEELQHICGASFTVKNRFEQREAFYKVMKSEKLISYFILFFILLIAAGNTIGSLYILVIEKKRDLELLGAMGLTSNQARFVFTWQGVIMAFVGGTIGLFLGVLLCYFQHEYGFIRLDQAASFSFNSYPVDVRWVDVVLVFFTVVFLGIITSIYPAYKAKQLIR
jgi:ABC-type lipoprotein release transport system permease subunit